MNGEKRLLESLVGEFKRLAEKFNGKWLRNHSERDDESLLNVGSVEYS